MDKESILDKKIREQRFPKCFKGDYHDFQDTMCLDERCEDCMFEPMCSLCVQKNLHRKPYHNSKLIKPFIIELLQFLRNEDNLKLKSQAIAEDQAEQIFKIDNLYKNLAKQFQRKGQQCYDIAKQLLNNLDIFHEQREDFTQQKAQAIEVIEKIASKDLDPFTLQNSLKKLSKIVTIKNNNLQINIQSIINSIQDLQKQAEIYANVYSDALNKFDVQIKFDQLYQHSYSTTIADNYQEQRIRNKKANITEFDRIKTEIGRSKEDQQELVDFTWMAIKNLKQRIFEKILVIKQVIHKIKKFLFKKAKDLALEQANSKGNHMNSKFYVNLNNRRYKLMTTFLFLLNSGKQQDIFIKKKNYLTSTNNLVGRCNLINILRRYKRLSFFKKMSQDKVKPINNKIKSLQFSQNRVQKIPTKYFSFITFFIQQIKHNVKLKKLNFKSNFINQSMYFRLASQEIITKISFTKIIYVIKFIQMVNLIKAFSHNIVKLFMTVKIDMLSLLPNKG
ncbi:hypothetical protein ABPG72_006317 [Tetrahymena utriculariae]